MKPVSTLITHGSLNNSKPEVLSCIEPLLLRKIHHEAWNHIMDQKTLEHLPPIHHHLGGHNLHWNDKTMNSPSIIQPSKALPIHAAPLKAA